MTDLTGEELKKLRHGDHDAFERLVRDNQENVFRVIVSVVRNEEDARDLAQDTFVKAYTSIASFNGISSVSTWLYRIAYNTALDFCRKSGKTPDSKSLFDEDDSEMRNLRAAEETQPEKAFERTSLRKKIFAALAELPEEQRKMIELRDVHGFSYEQISKMTGVREGTVKSRINRARESLRKKLSE